MVQATIWVCPDGHLRFAHPSEPGRPCASCGQDTKRQNDRVLVVA